MIFQTVSFAAIETFSASGEYTMSDYDTPEIAELRALDYARRNVTEQAGIYLESYSRSINFELKTDEIKTVASNNIKILGEPKISREILSSGVAKIRVDIKATVDTADLEAVIKKSQEERQQAINRYEDLQKITLKLDNDIAALKKRIAELKDGEPDNEISEEQERIDREFLSKQKLDEFIKFIYSKDLKYDLNIIDEAIKINPKNFKAYELRSIAGSFKLLSDMKKLMSTEQNKLSLHKLEIDFKDMNKAIIIAPDNESKCESITALAICYGLKAKYEQSMSNDEEATRSLLNKALKSFNKAIEIDPKRAKSYSSRGHFYGVTLKDYDKALADYNKAIELEPNDTSAYKERSKLYMELKNYPDALKDLETCRKLDEKNFSALDYMSLGDIYKELKNYSGALESYTKAIEIEEKMQIDWLDHRPLAYVMRAILYVEMGEFNNALADCENATKATEKTEMKFILQPLNKVKQTAVKGKGIADKYGKISPKDVDSFIKRGDDYYEESFYLHAIKDYTRAISIDPKNQLAYFQRGKTYNLIDDYKAALNDFDTLIKFNPKYEDGEAYIRRGLIYENQKEYKKALIDFTKALEINPNNGKGYYLRAYIYEKLEDFEKALTDCDKAIEILPTDDKLTQEDRELTLEMTLNCRQRVFEKLNLSNKPTETSDTKSLMEKANSLRDNKDYTSAIKI